MPFEFAKELLDIYTDGPMARLLSSVSKINDPDRWWGDVDQLIRQAAVEERYKQTESFALDVSDGDSAVHASMRVNGLRIGIKQTVEQTTFCGVSSNEPLAAKISRKLVYFGSATLSHGEILAGGSVHLTQAP